MDRIESLLCPSVILYSSSSLVPISSVRLPRGVVVSLSLSTSLPDQLPLRSSEN